MVRQPDSSRHGRPGIAGGFRFAHNLILNARSMFVHAITRIYFSHEAEAMPMADRGVDWPTTLRKRSLTS